MPVEKTEYEKEYDAAREKLDAAAEATTARAPDGKFAKAEPTPPEKEEPAKLDAKEAAPDGDPEKAEKPDPVAELTARLEKAEKIAKDNQAWATRMSQERAQEKREREAQERAANKPAILDANPELADAIRFVASDPAAKHQEEDKKAQFFAVVDKAHPGIFSKDIDPELEKALMTRLDALDSVSRDDPLVVIREITAEKLAHAERAVGKRFAAESAKLKEKSAMGVPGAGAGGGSRTAPDAAAAEVQRIQNMTDAEFAKEVRKVKGY